MKKDRILDHTKLIDEFLDRACEDKIKYMFIAPKVLFSSSGVDGQSMFGNGKRGTQISCKDSVLWTSPDLEYIAKHKDTSVYAYGYNCYTSGASSAKKYSGNILYKMHLDGFNVMNFNFILVEKERI